MTLVSIIIPAHNMESWIKQSIKSVLAQTIIDWECLVINDGSTDNTRACVKELNDTRIHIISQSKQGVSAARNAGINAAKGKFIAFLDADDIWEPKALEYMLSPLQNGEYDLAWANFLRFEDTSGRILPLPITMLQHTGTLWLDMLVDNFMQFGAFCLRTDLAKTQLFDTSLIIGEDRDWLLRITKGIKTIHVPQVVHYYRQRPNSSMRDTERFLHDEAKLMQKYLKDDSIPIYIKRRALSALNFHAAVLLAKTPSKKLHALKRYCQAIMQDPLYLENYLRPILKIWFKFTKQRYIIDIKTKGK